MLDTGFQKELVVKPAALSSSHRGCPLQRLVPRRMQGSHKTLRGLRPLLRRSEEEIRFRTMKQRWYSKRPVRLGVTGHVRHNTTRPSLSTSSVPTPTGNGERATRLAASAVEKTKRQNVFREQRETCIVAIVSVIGLIVGDKLRRQQQAARHAEPSVGEVSD